MGLSEDQRAMLRLLAQRGEQGYDDIAALMGLSVDEVRAKVAAALAQLDEEGVLSPSQVADAKAAEEATRSPTPEPEPPTPPAPESRPAEPEASKPAEPAKPAAVGSEAPPRAKSTAGRAPRRRRPRGGKPAGLKPPRLTMSSGTGLRAAIAAGVAVVALVVVILIVSGGGESSATGSGGGSGGEAATTGAEGSGSSKGREVTKAVLRSVDGGSARGVALFGRVKSKLALEVAAEGLEPTSKAESYTLWLSQSPQRMLPLASTAVGKDGKIAGQYEIPVEVLSYLANETFKDMVVTRTDNATLETALAKATKEKQAPSYTGTEILRGTVTGPVVGAAKRAKEKQATEKGE